MNKKELRSYIEVRVRDLAECKKVGPPTYIMSAVEARLDELNTLLKMFGEEN